MATIAKWGGHKFVVSAKRICSFSDLTIKGACDTETKVSGRQANVARKNGSAPEISFTIGMNAQLGVKDVYSEAIAFVDEATQGKSDYFYMGAKKPFSQKMMLTSAQVTDIEVLPGHGDKWISCKIAVTMKQGSGDAPVSTGGSGGSGGGHGSAGRQRASGAASAGRQASAGRVQQPTRQQVKPPEKPQRITGTPQQFGYHPPRPSIQ